MKRLIAALAALLSAACVRYPEPYRPPEQRLSSEHRSAPKLSHWINVNAPDAERHFLIGVMELNDNSWRWCGKRAVFQFQLPTTARVRLRADLTVPEISFRDTGPVKLTVRVAGKILEVMEYKQPGGQMLDKPVPEEWLTTKAPVQIEVETDKTWRAQGETIDRGPIVRSIGFVE